MVFIRSIFITLLLCIVGNGEFSCNNIATCDCSSHRDDFFLECSELLSIEIQKNEINLNCFSTEFNTSLLPKLNLSITMFQIRLCSMANLSFESIHHSMALNGTTSLKYTGADSPITLGKEQFEGLLELEELALTFNDLAGFDEDFLENLSNLKKLDLRNNKIQLAADFFQNNRQLEELDISGNQIVDLPDNIFHNLNHLQILNMWGNNLTVLNDNIFKKLYNLMLVELSGNKIANIGENIFADLTDLRILSLSMNNLQQVPRNLFRNNLRLEIILLDNNGNLTIPPGLFTNLTALTEVDLSHNNLSSIPDDIFRGCLALQLVRLTNNRLKVLPKELFADSRKLTELYLSNNFIETLSEYIAPLKSLQKLIVDNNRIERITHDAFWNLVNLEEINCEGNNINSIHPRALSNNRKLTVANFAHNSITMNNSKSQHLFKNCPHITHIDFSYNFIAKFDNFINLSNNVHLVDVNLSHNNITHIKVSELRGIGSAPLEIDLEENFVSTIDFTNVERLDFQQNLLDAHEIPTSIIHVSGNPIDCNCLSYDLFRYIKGEMTAPVGKFVNILADNWRCYNPPHLRNSELETIPDLLLVCPIQPCPAECSCSWRPADTTLVVDCSHRNYTQIPTANLTDLDFPHYQTELRFQHNQLTELPNLEKLGYRNITKLFLSHNRIDRLTWIPSKLHILQLDHNSLRFLNYTVIKALTASNFHKATFKANPWACDCPVGNLTKFLQLHAGQVDADEVRCADSGDLLVHLNSDSLCQSWTLLHLVAVILCSSIIIATLFACYYKFCREIKVWLFAKGWWCVSEDDLDSDKLYDVFISYCHQDEEFVVDHLVAALESGSRPYKVCVHYKSWIPGNFISKQIVDSIADSRRTLIVLSADFLESVWGRMEFRQAHAKAMAEGRTRVVVLLYGNVNTDEVDEELKSYLTTKTYIKWGEPLFWDKLRKALPQVNGP